MARSTARKRALNTLYEADEKSQDILSLLDERIAHPGAQTPLPDYAIEIVKGVAEHRRQIDMTLDEHSTGWKVRRMGVVDRNILRIAAWEILFNDDVPDKVAIDEALALAKTLCDDDSPAFIHGLLSAVCTAKNAAPAPESVAEEADEESSDSDAAASEPTDEGDVSDLARFVRCIRRACAPSAEIQPTVRLVICCSASPFGRLFHGRTLVPPYILKSAPCRQPRQRGETLRPTACESALPLTLVRIPEKHKGVLVSQNESGTIAIPMYDKDDAVLVLEDGQVYVGKPYGRPWRDDR